MNLLLRLVDVGGAAEERHVVAAGFRVVTKAGPNWIVTGPMSGLPKLLESDRIIYIEKASFERDDPKSLRGRRYEGGQNEPRKIFP